MKELAIALMIYAGIRIDSSHARKNINGGIQASTLPMIKAFLLPKVSLNHPPKSIVKSNTIDESEVIDPKNIASAPNTSFKYTIPKPPVIPPDMVIITALMRSTLI